MPRTSLGSSTFLVGFVYFGAACGGGGTDPGPIPTVTAPRAEITRVADISNAVQSGLCAGARGTAFEF